MLKKFKKMHTSQTNLLITTQRNLSITTEQEKKTKTLINQRRKVKVFFFSFFPFNLTFS